MKTDIILAGVGGQGILSIAAALGSAALNNNLYMKQAETHGMSQRGGSVVTYVKYGDAVYSPIVDRGTADLILAFEPLEAYRALPYLKQGGKMIANTQQIDPMPVIIGAMAYPENICEKLDAVCDLTAVDALQLAVQAGSQKCVNVVLIGVMAKSTEIPYEKWLETIRNTVPAKFLDMNLKAFELGYQAAK